MAKQLLSRVTRFKNKGKTLKLINPQLQIYTSNVDLYPADGFLEQPIFNLYL
jgi:hypothetical protein